MRESVMSKHLGRVVVVAGGGRGIGAATAERLALEGAHVLIGDLDPETAAECAERIVSAGGTAASAEFDIGDDDSCLRLIDVARDQFGGVDAVFNVAADLSRETLGRDTNIVDMPMEVWHRTLAVNLTGYFYMCRHAVPAMLERGGGAIVNTVSSLAMYGDSSRPAYTAAKSGVVALTRHISLRWGKHNIRCNAVAPGLVISDGSANTDSHEREAVLASIMSSRLGRPADIAATVAFLLSDDAEWINGQIHVVNGGR
jgi:NAD(P)-dependent dehydrogenase (short-subunit alcohol dehydrogenase family)